MNEFNEKFGKNYHVGPAGLVIYGMQRKLILTEEMQKNIMKDFDVLIYKQELDEELTTLERIALSLLFEGTYWNEK